VTARKALPSFRLVDGVIIAAIALLGLKVLGLFAGFGASPPAPAAAPPPQRQAAPANPSGFGRVLSHARTNFEPNEPTTTGSVPAKKEEPPADPRDERPAAREPAPPLQPPSASERLLLERLGERREELQQRSREMEARERMLQEQERKLEERLGQMKAAEESQKNAVATKASGDPNALKNVVIMYESMKPKEAARVFDRLPPEVLLSVVTQMNSRKMSEVLAMMTPENAEKLTVALAKRASAGEEPKPAAAPSGLPPGELPAIERPAAPRR
jgi:flagellar motility protein MotE (MotC chaperone)